nr:hypothetical protein [Tanacetum cinerariifolium]
MGFEQIKESYLTEVIPFFKTLKEHFESIQKALTKEIKEMKENFKELEAEVDQNVMNKKSDEIEQKNILIANDNLIADCFSKEVFYIVTNSELTVSRFTEMYDAYTVVQARCLELKVKLSKLMLRFNTMTIMNWALDFQITQLTEKVIVLQEQNKLFRVEKAKIKQHYKELYDSIQIMLAKHIGQTTALLTENKNLKESVATLREIVKEAKVERPLDRSLASAYLYRVNSRTGVSGSKPRSNTKKNRISSAKSVNKKKVEEHYKYSLTKANRVYSSISSKPRVDVVQRIEENALRD